MLYANFLVVLTSETLEFLHLTTARHPTALSHSGCVFGTGTVIQTRSKNQLNPAWPNPNTGDKWIKDAIPTN